MLEFTNITLKSRNLGEDSLIPDIHNSNADPFLSVIKQFLRSRGKISEKV